MIDWTKVRRVLVIRLRSIGDTVLSTPSLIALRRFLPNAKIDMLLEDWVAPVLEGHDKIDNVIAVKRGSVERLRTAWRLRKNRYDVVINLHGGTTSTFFTRATGAKHRIGYSNYQYSFLYNHLLASASDFWGQEFTHSAEQQLALLGFVGVPVDDKPKSSLQISQAALDSLSRKFAFPDSEISNLRSKIALLHPASVFATKQWSPENFAKIAEYLAARGIARIAVATKSERNLLAELVKSSRVPIKTFEDLTLPEITALASRASLFVGNDSGIAHIAAAVGTPSVVIFGSSNRNHWRPWTDAPNEIVFEPFACQPCAGYRCEVYGEPKCILSVQPATVIAAIDRVLAQSVPPAAAGG